MQLTDSHDKQKIGIIRKEKQKKITNEEMERKQKGREGKKWKRKT